MSKGAIGLVMAFSLSALSGAAGQVLDSGQLHRRADSLLALWREANTLGEVQQAVREVRHQRAAQVTRSTAAVRGENPVRAGDLMVIADYPDSIPLREAVNRAWTILSTTYGGHAASLTALPIRLTVMFSDRQRLQTVDGRRVPRNVTVDELERTLLGMAGQPKVDSRFSRWLGTSVRPVLDTGAERGSTYIELVTSGADAAVDCFKGVTAECVPALQLPEDSTFYLNVYDAAQRRGVVAAARQRDWLDPTDRATYVQCVDDRVDSACIDFLRSLPFGQVPQPLAPEARNLLVSTALRMGGAGAYDRLMADTTAPVIQRLEHAANAPLAKVVETWRSDVIAARPVATQVPVQDAALAIGWVGLIAFGAIRSTRWRLS